MQEAEGDVSGMGPWSRPAGRSRLLAAAGSQARSCAAAAAAPRSSGRRLDDDAGTWIRLSLRVDLSAVEWSLSTYCCAAQYYEEGAADDEGRGRGQQRRRGDAGSLLDDPDRQGQNGGGQERPRGRRTGFRVRCAAAC